MARQQRERGQRVQAIPLGGLGEIGKNCMAIQEGDHILVVDCGLSFPEEEMLGIDIVIPDFTYLLENRDKVRGLVLTHGHEDHIGAVPYLVRQLEVPVYATRLTLGLVEGKLAEAGLKLPPGSRAVKAGDTVKVGPFAVEFIRVTHSIPDSCALAIRTGAGVIVHTGDFKFDQTPVDGEFADYQRLAELGREGVLALLADSTNAERPGYTPSERVVGKNLDEIFRLARGRILLATFASNVHRIQQAIDSAARWDRKVAVVGRSMENTVEVALKLGYLHVPDGILVDVEELRRFPAQNQVILTTGSQGEPMSALTRMSVNDHKSVEIMPGDTVVFAATPIPGNEKDVARTINNLYRRGAEVIYGREAGVHVSGHGSQEEQKMMINLLRPRFFMPIHGEYRMLVHHARLAQACGIPADSILLGENGTVFEFTPQTAAIAGKVASGQVLVDGLGVGDVGNIVLRDRRQLSQDGILIVVVAIDRETGVIVGGPDIVSRGFVYVRESEGLLEEARDRVKGTLYETLSRRVPEWAVLKSAVRDVLSKYLFEKTRRRPMILPIIMEV
ncbi:ribonuclease J [Caldinitratiruptor microaerophilus]|uniref:Ribonuclease J n=1 Tax=Caldinitratiruptor microaerophilus TaxID=671077 RepID=A0AA35G5H8_9FIRM|nr:ribonuclease J [Caldinitratiruptor microaerophilus]BDG59431.1 ribonuclease J [Caldinitratiruptor microaerophilus]